MKISTFVVPAALAFMFVATATYGQHPTPRPHIGGPAPNGGEIRPCSALGSPGSCSPGPSVDVTRYIPPPNNNESGAVRLKIHPATAAVYVDGRYAGRVDRFDGDAERLVLKPGSHAVVIRAPGFAPLEIETRTRAGQTTIYCATLSALPSCGDESCGSGRD